MPVLIGLTVILHAIVLLCGARFFRSSAAVRDQDKHIVAAAMAGSVMLLVAQASGFVTGETAKVAWIQAFMVFNGILYLTIISGYVKSRKLGRGECETKQPPTTP